VRQYFFWKVTSAVARQALHSRFALD